MYIFLKASGHNLSKERFTIAILKFFLKMYNKPHCSNFYTNGWINRLKECSISSPDFFKTLVSKIKNIMKGFLIKKLLKIEITELLKLSYFSYINKGSLKD